MKKMRRRTRVRAYRTGNVMEGLRMEPGTPVLLYGKVATFLGRREERDAFALASGDVLELDESSRRLEFSDHHALLVVSRLP